MTPDLCVQVYTSFGVLIGISHVLSTTYNFWFLYNRSPTSSLFSSIALLPTPHLLGSDSAPVVSQGLLSLSLPLSPFRSASGNLQNDSPVFSHLFSYQLFSLRLPAGSSLYRDRGMLLKQKSGLSSSKP